MNHERYGTAQAAQDHRRGTRRGCPSALFWPRGGGSKDVHFHGVVEANSRPFGDDVVLLPLSCIPFSNEVIVLHKPSRTLIVTDLVFNISPSAPWLTRAAMRCLCGYPGCRTTLIERVGMRREVARRELSVLADWDFERVIMAHGDIVEVGAKAALLEALRWLSITKTGLLTG